ncbi:hypothetical protein EVAR_44129_1 [Eumeta japonica]|uniref:Uncharacterized protein n=1 Tax=Eumeta variegata TaxID=151549 RepID=A0A4C1XJF1_EUMVA|nr:hypothetical protein EVAR_44129_1 [Eumeta japonica]
MRTTNVSVAKFFKASTIKQITYRAARPGAGGGRAGRSPAHRVQYSRGTRPRNARRYYAIVHHVGIGRCGIVVRVDRLARAVSLCPAFLLAVRGVRPRRAGGARRL